MKKIITPLTDSVIEGLRTGETIYLSGVIYTARDMAHKKMNELIDKGLKLPFDLRGAVIYYAGPTPAPKGKVVGSIGPTSSYRMDKITPGLLQMGLKGMIGKGKRSPDIREKIKQFNAVYFAAVGGAAVTISETVKSCKIIAFPELGTEAVRELVVEKLPLIVADDMYGGDIFEEGENKYKKV